MMRCDKVEIYIHLIWTTWEREPWITPELEALLFPVICEMVERHGAKMLAINGSSDHIHLLIKMASTTRLCDFVEDAKGVSSRVANQQLDTFKWRPTYAAFSVSRRNVRDLCGYIARQKEHHANGTTHRHLESSDDEETQTS